MNREQLGQYIGVTAHSLGQVEKDYLQHIVLGAYSRKIGSILVFKGGTALQKTGVIPRFSEDLDFTLRGPVELERLEQIALGSIGAYNHDCEVDKEVDDERAVGFRLRVKGPLYQGPTSISTIRIEASKREVVLQVPERKELHPLYADVLPYLLEVMGLREIAAEKVRTLFTRRMARDLYDLHKIVSRQISIDLVLVDKKLEYYEMTYDRAKLIERCKTLKNVWKSELERLVERVPDFKIVMKDVISKLPK